MALALSAYHISEIMQLAAGESANMSMLPCEERAYLLGLYFTDGCKSPSGVQFTLASYEREIVDRIAKFFGQLNLSPRVYTYPAKANCIRVHVNDIRLRSFFPDKNEFSSLELEDSRVQRWIKCEHLEGDLGVPFIGGLLDGDGYVDARVEFKHTTFGSLHSYWSLFQMNYPFLVDFTRRYVESLASGGAAFNRVKQGKLVKISGQGMEALLSKGIAMWSVKISNWINKVELLGKQISSLKMEFLSPKVVAVKLQHAVNRCTIREWCNHGFVKHIRIRQTSASPFKYLIPVTEVQRLKEEIAKNKIQMESMMSTGEYLTVELAAYVMGVKPETVYHYCHQGKLKNIPIMTAGGKRKKSLIPINEVDTWLQKKRRAVD
jgi:hypothetical protein